MWTRFELCTQDGLCDLNPNDILTEDTVESISKIPAAGKRGTYVEIYMERCRKDLAWDYPGVVVLVTAFITAFVHSFIWKDGIYIEMGIRIIP